MQLITPSAISKQAPVSRASEGSFVNRDGKLEYVGNDIARPNYDTDGTWLGVLNEPERTNLAQIDPVDLSAARSGANGWYTGVDLANIFDVTANSTDITAVDGGADKVTKFVRNANPGAEGLFARHVPGTNITANDYVQSIWIYVPTQSGVTNFQLGMDIGNIAPPGFAFTSPSTTFDRWVRMDVALTTDAIATFFDYRIIINGQGNASPPQGFTFYAMCGQLEQGDTLTSFIRQAGGTRAAETFNTVTGLALINSSIPLPSTRDNAVIWDPAQSGGYNANERVIREGGIYASAIGSNTGDPLDPQDAASPDWVYQGEANRYAMFDLTTGIDTGSENAEAIELIFRVTDIIDALSFFNLEADNVLVEIITASDGQKIYSETTELVSDEGINDFWDWFYKPRTTLSRFTSIGVPGLFNSYVRVKISRPGAVAKCGKLIIGLSEFLGVTKVDVEAELISTSVAKRDTFGNLRVEPGREIDLTRYDVYLNTDQEDAVYTRLKNLGTANVVFIGEISRPLSINYGRRKSLRLTMAGAEVSVYSLQIEGL